VYPLLDQRVDVALRESIARGNRGWEAQVLLALHRLSRVSVVVDGWMNRDWS
jgi:hypothetical protein